MSARIRATLIALLVALVPVGLSSQGPASGAIAAAMPAPGCAAFPALLADAVQGQVHGQAGASQDAPHAAAKTPPAFNVSNLDPATPPCTDFYQFAAGGWIKNNPVPSAYSRWGSFDMLRQHNEDVLHFILDDASNNPKASTEANWQKIGDFYASCMNEAQVESAGTKPLQPEFDRINAINDVPSLEKEIALLNRQGVRAALDFGSSIDFKNSAMRIAEADQGGLGLPDRDYYLRTDDKSKKIRDQYVAHMTNMFKLLGDNPMIAPVEAATVLSLETDLARASMKTQDLRNPDNVYHKMTLEQIKALTPHFSWTEYVSDLGAPSVSAMNIAQPDFFKALDGSLQSVPLADWKTYLRWHLVHSFATSLPKAFVDENFAFYSTTLTGEQEQQPRWRRCVRSTDRQLGEALGQYYVKRAFPPAAKASALVMVKNLIAALRDDLKTLDWMSPETRKQALVKLDAFTLKIGYPDKWRAYSGFKVTRDPYVLDVQRGNSFNVAFDLNKIDKPVDRTEWDMTPSTVNAYYNPSANEIVFPAGILQPPFFNPKADNAINYGGIGAVIGHEMTHGFDDEGAKFDAKGNLKNWWTPEDLKNFEARGDCIVKQFASYSVEPGLNLNGKLVEGESIADLGGITIAYRAFQKTLAGKPAPPKIDGFTADQRFFLGFGQIWISNIRIEMARVLVQTDGHPPDKDRVNGPLSNTPAFAKAFNCPANSPMVRPADARCRIW